MKIQGLILAAAAILLGAATLHAEPVGYIIYPGVPKVHPGNSLMRPSFTRLIPSSGPVIQPGAPKVYPGNRLVHPMDMPLVPKCIP